jgi:uncharacterized protein (DUF58 family)
MSKPRRNTLSFALIAGTMSCVALSALVIALASRQRGDLAGATFWLRSALLIFVLLVLYALPKLAQLVNPDALPFRLPLQTPGIGAVFGIFVGVVAIFAFGTGNNLLYLIFSLLLATLIVSTVAARLNLTRLDLAVQPPKHLFAGEPAALELILSNRKRLLPTFSLTVALGPLTAKIEGESKLHELAFFAIVPPRAKARARVRHTFAQRGVYPLRNLAVVTRFPFGLLERGYALDSDAEIVVYPRLLSPSEVEQTLPVALGQLESTRKGSGSDLYAIRQYQPADHRHAIDWKATAKTANLMVREFTRDDDWRVTVIFDVQATTAESEKFERAISLTASLLEHFIAAGAEVRLLLSETDCGYGSSRAHWYAMLRELARLQTVEENARTEVETEASASLERLLQQPLGGSEFRLWLTSAPLTAVPAAVKHSTQVVHFAEL